MAKQDDSTEQTRVFRQATIALRKRLTKVGSSLKDPKIPPGRKRELQAEREDIKDALAGSQELMELFQSLDEQHLPVGRALKDGKPIP